MAAVATAGLGWFVGFPADRVALAVLAVVVLVLVARADEPVEGWWPEAASRPTRPGWHGVAATQRLLETARTDPGDRAVVRARLDRLPPDDPGALAVRRTVGLSSTRPPRAPTAPTAPAPPTTRSTP